MPKLKTQCMTLPLNNSQQTALNEHSLYCCSYIVLLRSSTHNIVLPSLSSIASKFDSRVSHSEGDDGKQKENGNADSGAGFALVVMEMVDSKTAGVAFSANPINSDRDECVIDSSYGLGISVVDGSVTADRYIYDKVMIKLKTKWYNKLLGVKK